MANPTPKTRSAFNVETQKVENAVVTIDSGGDYVLTFADNTFFKLNGNMTRKEIDDHLAIYEQRNTGQIKAADHTKSIQDKLDRI